MLEAMVEVNVFISMESIHQPSKGYGHEAGLCHPLLTQVWKIKQLRKNQTKIPPPAWPGPAPSGCEAFQLLSVLCLNSWAVRAVGYSL